MMIAFAMACITSLHFSQHRKTIAEEIIKVPPSWMNTFKYHRASRSMQIINWTHWDMIPGRHFLDVPFCSHLSTVYGFTAYRPLCSNVVNEHFNFFCCVLPFFVKLYIPTISMLSTLLGYRHKIKTLRIFFSINHGLLVLKFKFWGTISCALFAMVTHRGATVMKNIFPYYI